jgi:hypothetical protein
MVTYVPGHGTSLMSYACSGFHFRFISLLDPLYSPLGATSPNNTIGKHLFCIPIHDHSFTLPQVLPSRLSQLNTNPFVVTFTPSLQRIFRYIQFPLSFLFHKCKKFSSFWTNGICTSVLVLFRVNRILTLSG